MTQKQIIQKSKKDVKPVKSMAHKAKSSSLEARTTKKPAVAMQGKKMASTHKLAGAKKKAAPKKSAAKRVPSNLTALKNKSSTATARAPRQSHIH